MCCCLRSADRGGVEWPFLMHRTLISVLRGPVFFFFFKQYGKHPLFVLFLNEWGNCPGELRERKKEWEIEKEKNRVRCFDLWRKPVYPLVCVCICLPPSFPLFSSLSLSPSLWLATFGLVLYTAKLQRLLWPRSEFLFLRIILDMKINAFSLVFFTGEWLRWPGYSLDRNENGAWATQ